MFLTFPQTQEVNWSVQFFYTWTVQRGYLALCLQSAAKSDTLLDILDAEVVGEGI